MISDMFRDKVDRTIRAYKKRKFNRVDNKIVKGLVKRKFKSDDSMNDIDVEEEKDSPYSSKL
jgi:hypothetical protein